MWSSKDYLQILILILIQTQIHLHIHCCMARPQLPNGTHPNRRRDFPKKLPIMSYTIPAFHWQHGFLVHLSRSSPLFSQTSSPVGDLPLHNFHRHALIIITHSLIIKLLLLWYHYIFSWKNNSILLQVLFLNPFLTHYCVHHCLHLCDPVRAPGPTLSERWYECGGTWSLSITQIAVGPLSPKKISY